MVMQRAAEPMVVDAPSLAGLRQRLAGEMILPGDVAYDSTRRVWNAAYDRYPAVIVRARDAADVIQAVRFARQHELPLAVRSGGHSMAGHGAVDGGVVVNVAGMKGLSIDPERGVAWAQPGLTAGEYGEQAQVYGLATPFGDAGTVGISGLTLGGGVGYLARKHGLTVDNLLSAEVVTADGRLLTASETEHADLFWALRGGGGNFGIVTAFEYRLLPVGMILGGALVHEATAETLERYYQAASEAPEGLTTISFVVQAPPLPFIPPEKVGSLILLTTLCFTGDVEAGMAAVAPLRGVGKLIGEAVMPMPYTGLYQLTAEGAVSRPHAIRNGLGEGLDRAMAESIMDHARGMTSPFSVMQLRVLGGAVSRVPAGATAFAHRDKNLMLTAWSAWEDPTEAAVSTAWVERAWRDLEPKLDGAYVNFLGSDGPERIEAAYPSLTRQRLAAIKGRYDPTNFFRVNQNIRPASDGA
jgi:FAD/FMN-containing dehydrogenase